MKGFDELNSLYEPNKNMMMFMTNMMNMNMMMAQNQAFLKNIQKK
jgi:hypothetical protein